MKSAHAAFLLLAASAAAAGCLRHPHAENEGADGDGSFLDAIEYRDDLAAHPGCSTAGLAYAPAQIPGFACAAREYTTHDDGGAPIVLLIHGNSDSPRGWEASSNPSCDPQGADEGAPMLAEKLAAAGRKVIALDMRADLVDDPAGNNDTENAARNMSHGWGTPLAEHFIRAVLDANPGRHIQLVGFSFGVTVARDALRRLDVDEGYAVWPRVDDVVLLAGGNHGVSTFALCATNATMRGEVTCEMGDRAAYSPTPFLAALNGPAGAWETPCHDGAAAFDRDVCGGHSVTYTTIVMKDLDHGTQQDPFVSEASSALLGADNETVALTDFDQSDYFFCGLFKDHYGAARSQAALAVILAALGA